MPNHWMDQIVKILEDYYEEKIPASTAIAKVNVISIDYQKEFKKYDDAITDQMVEMEGYVQD
tara:strand:- start:670 stop:855 length:186 start_codon:yes stop_codon:yes gene_type:complete